MKLAIVGCGAVTEFRHLPALVGRDDCEVVAVVDRDVARAGRLAAQVRSEPRILTEARQALDAGAAAAIVCLPNALHAAVAVDFLKAGIHVLVEKPMAVSVAECDAMVQAAEGAGAVLAVGMPRRFLHAGRFVRWAVENGVLGRIVSFDVQDGGKFNWPLATDFFFRREMAGGGVLIDTGVHTLDQLLWWLGDIESVEYYDDAAGGVESECELRLTLKSGARGVIELTRTRPLRGTAIVRGERAEVEVGLNWNTISLRFTDAPWRLAGAGVPVLEGLGAEQNQIDLMVAEHDDFFAAIRGERAPEVDGRAGTRAVAWIETCYRTRRPLALPWSLG